MQQNMYPNNQYQYQQMPQQNVNNQNTNIVWVQGIAGAKAYPVPPGCALSLWDSESNVIYVKMVDTMGIPQPIRIFDYKERVVTQESQDSESFVTEDKLNKILDEKFAAFAQSLQESNNNNNQRGGRK